MILHLDTHVLVYLYAAERTRFPARARAALDHARLLYSAIAELETPHVVVARTARTLPWTRDPFDRMITAAALASDGLICRHVLHTLHAKGDANASVHDSQYPRFG